MVDDRDDGLMDVERHVAVVVILDAVLNLALEVEQGELLLCVVDRRFWVRFLFRCEIRELLS